MEQKRRRRRVQNHISSEDIAPALLENQPDTFVVEVPEVEEEKVEVKVYDTLEDQEEIDGEIFYEKKSFFVSEYDKVESYLESKSQMGYHYVKNKGKKYFFREGKPENYYYTLLYYQYDPEASQWKEWEQDGWKLMYQLPGKKNHEAGWFILRNTLGFGEYKKTIDNDLEKYNLFKKQANSYRSTMFLYFIIMAICSVTIFMILKISGFLEALISSIVILVIALILFFVYAYHLVVIKKTVKRLKTRLRLKEKEDFIRSQNEPDYSQTLQELDTDWNTMEQSERVEPEKRRRRKKME